MNDDVYENDNDNNKNNNKIRLVVTMTTLPGREDIIIPTINSIINQTLKPDIIYLTLPSESRRLKLKYGPMPNIVVEHCSIIHVDVDYGPVTKLYGGLMFENVPDTIIISCDDDVIYPSDTFELLYQKSLIYPDSCICGSGMLIKWGIYGSSTFVNMNKSTKWNSVLGTTPPMDGRNVDLIFGVVGVLYKRRFFGSHDECMRRLFQFSLSDNDILCNDDVLISGYLCLKGIKRRVFPDLPVVTQIESEGQHPEVALSMDAGVTSRFNRAINKIHDAGYFVEYEPVYITETAAGNIVVQVVFVLLAIILLIMIIYAIHKVFTY